MYKRIMAIVVMVAFVAFMSFDPAFAYHWKHKKGEVINDTCPVKGGKVDKETPYKVEHKGKTIGFCRADCVEKFKANPKKYMKKLKRKKCIIKCPHCGAEIDMKEACKKAKMKRKCPMSD